MKKILRGLALVNIRTTQLETTAESAHSVWELDIVRQVMNSAYSNVYVRQTALFTHHLTEGLKPVHGDYPQVQLKPELNQINTKVDETVRDWLEGEEDPLSWETELGILLNWVHIKMVVKMEANEGTYEDLYNLFSRTTQD